MSHLDRAIVEPANAKLNASRNRNLPHSPGVRVGNYILLSGRGATNPDTGEPERGPVLDQIRCTFGNIEHMLESCGSSMARVVRVHMVFADPGHMTQIEDVFREFFPIDPPARTIISLQLRGDSVCEIECVALAGAALREKRAGK